MKKLLFLLLLLPALALAQGSKGSINQYRPLTISRIAGLQAKLDSIANLASGVGSQGPQGVQGIPGSVGSVGPQGLQGIQGPKGDVGTAGATGSVGPQGVAGPKGDTGAQGIQGVSGPVGAMGATGPQGVAGPQGPIGLTGPQGTSGLTGATGPTGSAGANGITPTITFAPPVTLAYGSNPTSTTTGTPTSQTVTLGIPAGKTGNNGAAGAKGDPASLYGASGLIAGTAKVMSFTVVPTVAMGQTIDISSAGFTNVLSVQCVALRNVTDPMQVPNVGIKSVSNSSVSVNITQPNNATVAILGINVLSGGPSVAATPLNNIVLHFTVLGI